MNDFYAGELTREEPVSRTETSIREQMEEITKMLYETNMALRSTLNGLIGMERPDDSLVKEDKCMQDSVFTVRALSEECMKIAIKIKSVLF